jgi:cell division septation protein DedD
MALAAAMPDNPVALSRALAASGRGGPALDDAGEPADGQDAGYRRSSGTYRVQLAAVTARDAAEEEWRRLNRLHGDLLSGLELHVETVDVDGRDYHRIQAGPVDPQAARALCDAIRERGADCLVRP